ncbi:MAG TPA: hypothetical protein PJ982_06560, partial [Lacipirellulaceae bacterium]|nr:hypothetical protein [Lacipirellulaceae bacterium]
MNRRGDLSGYWLGAAFGAMLAAGIAAMAPVGVAAEFDLTQVAWDQCADGTPAPAPDCGCGVAVAAAPGFGGPGWERTKLTGDWGGMRTDLADSGITLDADSTSFYFGNTRGGLNRQFRYGGHSDYVVNVDSGKLGLMEGQFLKLRAEHRYAQTINRDTGAFMPAPTLPGLPVP